MSKGDYPLSDLRVLELTEGSLGVSLCARMLAELGASVIAVDTSHDAREDRRHGAEIFEISSYAKQRICIDMAKDGSDKLKELIDSADVLLVDIEWHRKKLKTDDNPSLIVCCISCFGVQGPFADVPGSEFTVQAISGVLASNGDVGDAPTKTGVPIGAYGGATYAFISILAALYKRHFSGRGQFIDQSEFDALISFQGTLIPGYLLRGASFQRLGNRHSSVAPWNTYRTKDGWIVISTVGDEQWRSLALAMGRENLVDDPRFRRTVDRVENIDQLDSEIEAWSSSINSADLLQILERSEVPASSILTVNEAVDGVRALEASMHRMGDDAFPRLPFTLEKFGSWRWSDALNAQEAVSGWKSPRIPIGTNSAAGETGPLDGIRVVEVSMLTAGPLAGRILGMLGAEVIKVESPSGERTRHVGNQIGGTSYLFHLNNTDKLSISIDTSIPDDRAALTELCQSADVLISNISHTSLKSMGISPPELEVINDQLIFCSISGYGQTGEKRGRKTFDMVVQAETGIMSLTGPRDGRPTKAAMSVVDLLSALNAVAGTIAALIARIRYGQGQTVDSSLFGAGLWMTQICWPPLIKGTGAPKRMGNRSRLYAPQGCFRASDGWIAITIRSDREWRDWLQLAGKSEPHLATVRERVNAADETEKLIAEWAANGIVSELVASCIGLGIAAAPALTLAQAIEHPLTTARNMLVTVDAGSVGPIKVIGSPIKMSSHPVSVRTAAPALGANNGDLQSLLEQKIASCNVDLETFS